MNWVPIIVLAAGMVALTAWVVKTNREITRAQIRGLINDKIDGLQYDIDHLDQSDLRSLESYENDLSAMLGDGDASREEYQAHRARIRDVENQISELKHRQDALRELLDEVPT